MRPRLFPAALFAFCLVALPALPEDIAVYDPELPDGYPPKMGDVWGALGDKAVAWETFDFSIGAFDASAWVGAGYEEPVMTLRIMAYPPGEPDTMAGRVFAKAEFGDVLHVGTGMNVEVSIMQGDDIDGVRMSSEGQSAALTIESIGPARENSYNRRLVGNIEARLCPVDWEGQACQDVRLRFDTDVQIESAVMIRE